jgi:hypothetical protein
MTMRSKLTKKQIQANRERAKKSTGPRTPEGKARSARNALKHGMYAESLLVFGENERLLDEITRQYYEDFAPANIHERMLLEQMICAQWRLLRVARSRVPNTADWDQDLNRAIGQEKIYASIYRSYSKAAAQLERSRAQRGALPPVIEREQAQPIPVNPFEDPLSEINSPPKSRETGEFHDSGFVPAKCDAGPPVSCIRPGCVIYPPEEEAA